MGERRPDVVVVGGGSSGAVLAARLSERADRSVLLLEAGRAALADPPGPVLDASSLPGHTDTWVHRDDAELGRGVRGVLTRGELLGGGSAVNAGYFIRATAADVDGWFGGEDAHWSADAVLSSFVRLERDLDLGPSDLHGASGPVPVRRHLEDDALTSAFTEACLVAGHRSDPDKNGWGPPGIGPVPRNVLDGARVSTAMAYLAPAAPRPNLEILTGRRVRRVRIESGRVVGVELDGPDGPELVTAERVVLCAGAVSSAQLLLLSGVGPADDLRRVGIDVVVDAPGVGTRCSDHAAIDLSFLPVDDSDRGGSILGAALHSTVELDGSQHPYEVLAIRRSYGRSSGDDPDDPALHLRVSPMAPSSLGRVALQEFAPAAAPRIDLAHLDDPTDRRVMRAVLRATAQLLASGEMAPVVAELLDPPPVADSDTALDGWIDRHLGTSMHLSGTVPMGPEHDPTAVVDHRCGVRGVDGLYVVDTSVLPKVPSRGPAATAVMLGEHAVEFFD